MMISFLIFEWVSGRKIVGKSKKEIFISNFVVFISKFVLFISNFGMGIERQKKEKSWNKKLEKSLQLFPIVIY